MKIRYKLEDGALPPCYAKPGDAGALLALADYMGSGFVGEHTKTIAMIRRKVG